MADSTPTNPGYGFLFPDPPEKRKEGGPQFRGRYTGLDGVEMEIAAWPKTSKAGNRYLSLKVQRLPQAASAEDEEDCPF
jgi:uncharacterized protein (DUF736 family)